MHSIVSDGALHPASIVKLSRSRRINVISITDHDTFLGSIIASKYVSKPQILIYGAEVRTYIGDVLVLCPSVIKISKDLWELVDLCRDSNCLVVPAHPFDVLRLGIGRYVGLDIWDAIEVFNASSDPVSNTIAYLMVHRLGKPLIANSDAHVAELIGASHSLVYVDNPTVDDVLEMIRRSKVVPVMRYNLSGHIPKLAWSLRRRIHGYHYLKVRLNQ